MNTLSIEVGFFTSLADPSEKTVMIIARDPYAEAIFSYESPEQAIKELPTEQALVEQVLSHPELDDIEIDPIDENGHVDLRDTCLLITGYHQLKELAKS